MFKDTQLREKSAKIEQTRKALKEEFIGLDSVIDEVMDAITPWYIYPDIQTRPLVINLWGQTGTGKTQLVRSLKSHLGFDNAFYHADMGLSDNGMWNLKSAIEDMVKYEEDQSVILCFDEFQKARTIDPIGREEERTGMRPIWELIDAGLVKIEPGFRSTGDYFKAHNIMHKFMLKGCKIELGRMVNFQDEFSNLIKNEFESDYKESGVNDIDYFIPGHLHEEMYDIYSAEFDSFNDFRKYLLSLSAEESVKLVYQAFRDSTKTREVDLSSSLIFIIGNLDEAFVMHSNLDPDLDADAFARAVGHISITDIKNALQRRFASEQIARLGNHHIVYPSLDRSSFQKLIEKSLKRDSTRFEEKTGIRLNCTAAFRELIYQEGVFPTQGTRPVLSTLQSLFNSRLPAIALAAVQHKTEGKQHTVDYSGGKIEVSTAEKSILKVKPHLRVIPLRKNVRNDAQCTAAVHESGHAIVSAVLLRRSPKEIRSISSQQSVGGWNHFEQKDDIENLFWLKAQIAILYGGLVAEELVFGKEHVSKGSSNDLSEATSTAFQMVMHYGMLSNPAQYTQHLEMNPEAIEQTPVNKKEINDLLDEGYRTAKHTLINEKKWLLELSHILSNNPSLSQEEFEKTAKSFCENSSLKKLGFIKSTEGMYRNILQHQRNENQEYNAASLSTSHATIYLNKDA